MSEALHPPNGQFPTRRSESSRRLARFIAIALLVHAELALLVGVGLYLFAPRDSEVQARLAASREPESIDIGMVDEDAARRILADIEREEERRQAEQVKKEIDAIKAPGQVVDIPKPREERRPAQARFAAEYDSTVERETRQYGKFDPDARQGDAAGTATESRPEVPRATPGAKGPSDGSSAARLALRASPSSRSNPRAGRSAAPGVDAEPPTDMPYQPDGELPSGGSLKMRPESGAGEGPPSKGGLTLMPSPAQLARAIGSGTQDALKDVEDGPETALNSKQWRFASFFNRVKHQVQEHWHPDEVYRRRDPSGAIYGRTSRLTIVRVHLKPDGKLANIALEQPSGLEFLDDEALQAFRAAQPFPNPPRQLVNDGLISFSFGFLFEISGVSRPLLFKYNM